MESELVTRLLERVRHEREQRGLTQEAFAEQAGLPPEVLERAARFGSFDQSAT